jgi:hypothetical protein
MALAVPIPGVASNFFKLGLQPSEDHNHQILAMLAYQNGRSCRAPTTQRACSWPGREPISDDPLDQLVAARIE